MEMPYMKNLLIGLFLLSVCPISLGADDYGDSQFQDFIYSGRFIVSSDDSFAKICPPGYKGYRDWAIDDLLARDLISFIDNIHQMHRVLNDLSDENQEAYLALNSKSVFYWKLDLAWLGIKAIENGLVNDLVNEESKKLNPSIPFENMAQGCKAEREVSNALNRARVFKMYTMPELINQLENEGIKDIFGISYNYARSLLHNKSLTTIPIVLLTDTLPFCNASFY
jgi:hypothetical protein